MNGSRFAEQARQLLQDSLDEINALKNANIRDPGFKQWRQNALTLIQRLCPGDSARSDRFRRVPFSPPSSRADQRTAREWYERGCAEASQLMRALLLEIEQHGVPQPMSPLPAAEPESEYMEGDFPTVSLPGDEPAEPPARDKHAEPRRPARSEAPPKRATPPPNLEETLREVTGGEAPRRAPPAKPAPKGRSVAERLKDMLGLGDVTPGRQRQPEPEPEPAPEIEMEVEAPEPPPYEEPEPQAEAPEPRRAAPEPRRAAPEPRRAAPEPRRAAPEPPRASRAPQREPAQREPAPPARREPAPPAPRASATPKPRQDVPPPRPRHEEPAPPRPKREEPATPRRDLRAREVEDDEPIEAVEQPEFHYPADEHEAEPAAAYDDEPAQEMAYEVEDVDYFARDDEPIAMDPEPEPEPEPQPEYAEEAVEELAMEAAEPEADDAPLADQLPAWMRGQAAEPRRVSEGASARDTEDDASRRARARREERLDAGEVTPLPAPERPRHRDPQPARPDAAPRPPAPTARPRPAERAAQPMPTGSRALTSPTAIALAAIASQVNELGVPEGHRARTRAALLELARQVEGRDLSWDVLREAVVFLVDYPPLARRVLPLLIPHLDQAA